MYIGTQPYQGFRARHTYTATAGQTSFSGAGAENVTLTYSDEMYIDVYQKGVKLSPADYTATSGTTVVLATGATVNDIVEVVKYDAFSVADTVSAKDGGGFGGNISTSGTLAVTGTSTLTGNVTAAGTLAVTGETTLATHLNMGDGDIIKLGADADLQIQHNGTNSIIRDNGTGALDLQVSNFAIVNLASDEFLAKGTADDAFELYHNGGKRLETTSSGVTVSGGLTTTTASSIEGGVVCSGVVCSGIKGCGGVVCSGIKRWYRAVV